MPDFRSRAFLLDHIRATMAFYHPRAVDPDGGFFHFFRDDASADWGRLSPYRGQNANMHSCEAMLAAYDATGERRYLERAETLARNITVRQADLAQGLIWEHYHSDWSVDWEYNKNDRTNIFRPWGFQPGHLTEWAKLLLILDRHRARLRTGGAWLVPRACQLFDAAWTKAWDAQYGGVPYGFWPGGGHFRSGQ